MNIYDKLIDDFDELRETARKRRNNGINTYLAEKRYVEQNVKFSVNKDGESEIFLFSPDGIFDFQDFWDHIKWNGKEIYKGRIKRGVCLPSEINGVKMPLTGYLFDLNILDDSDVISVERAHFNPFNEYQALIGKYKNADKYPLNTVNMQFDRKKDFDYFMSLFSLLSSE